LTPVLGFKVFSYMGFTWVFAHFLYIPMIGLIGLTFAALEQIENRLPVSRRPLLMAGITTILVLFMLQAHAYAENFFNQETLWTYELKYNDLAWPAHDNLGNVFFVEGRIDEAVQHYQRSLSINPYRFEAHNNLGLALSLRGHYAEAIDQYVESLQIKSDYAPAHVNMADALVKMGRTQEAKSQYKQALEIDPDNAGARDRLSKLQ
jgi:tetratricopeptide (TPR) repeat protein